MFYAGKGWYGWGMEEEGKSEGVRELWGRKLSPGVREAWEKMQEVLKKEEKEKACAL